MEKLYNKKEVAKLFGVSTRTIDLWIASKKLKVIRLMGKTIRIKESEVKRIMEG